MTADLVTFTKDRLTRLWDEYALDASFGKSKLQFDEYDCVVNYAKHPIQDLEDHFEKSKKTKQVYRFTGNSM